MKNTIINISVESITNNNGQINGVSCFLTEANGKTHMGLSRCNLQVDTFNFEEGMRLAMRRAIFAMETGTTACFPKSEEYCMFSDV